MDKNNYDIHKTDQNTNLSLIKEFPINIILSNDDVSLSEFNFSDQLKFKKIKFNELVINNLKQILDLPKQKIIEPVYVSNNQILN